ncbi:MAG TPA: 1,6-anhydro-N-acetylmuramyl-L-alanine amidase AmpD [Gammaproteobacteria bacterium]|nr:1,6-anhydro-N-acetylmuramyl-L-alanine amidase AmpD [Gammaproteobacteria bacterium]
MSHSAARPTWLLDPATGRLPGARWRPSPHCDARPAGTPVDLLVVHGISLPPGEFGGPAIEQLFLGKLPFEAHPYFERLRDLRVSAHFLIRRDGELLQFVSCAERAWHAGASSFEGRAACNDYSIGVELEGTDERPYELIQYRHLAELARSLMRAYTGITPERIVGHSDVAPGRKTDPGPGFDWSGFRRALASAP